MPATDEEGRYVPGPASTDGAASDPDDFLVTTSSAAGAVTVQVRGELDIFTSPELDRWLRAALAQSPDCVTLHMGGVRFIDSSALAILVACDRRALEAGSRLVIASPSPQVRRILDLVGLSEHLTVQAD